MSGKTRARPRRADGKSILFGSFFAKKLFVAPVQGGEARQVSQELDGDIMGFCWSPDGKHIAYGWRAKPDDEEGFIMVVNADGSKPAVLYEEKCRFPSLILSGWR